MKNLVSFLHLIILGICFWNEIEGFKVSDHNLKGYSYFGSVIFM